MSVIPTNSVVSRAGAEIPKHLRVEAAHVAFSITSAVGEMRERALMIGELLLQMKRQLARGVFTAWVRSACGLNMRTAENYMLAYTVAQIHPVLRDTKKFNLDALYQLGRIANSDERRAELRQIFLNSPLDTPIAVITELKMKLAASDTSYRALSAVADHTPSISQDQQIEPAIIVELAEALGDRLSDLVDLVRDHGAIAVCDALIAFQRDFLETKVFRLRRNADHGGAAR